MSDDVSDDRLDRLRGDLAALRAKTAEEFGVELVGRSPAAGEAPVSDVRTRRPPPDRSPSPRGADPDATPRATDVPPIVEPPPPSPAATEPVVGGPRPVDADEAGDADHRAPPRRRWRAGTPRPPRPPRRSPFRRRPTRPPSRLAVPAPIEVRRRPGYLAGPRWPTWTWVSGVAVALVALPSVAQLAYRLAKAMEQTSFLLGADPTRTDHLRAAAGVAGGGITIALAIAALAVVRGRPGYLTAAASALVLFGVFPFVAASANAGIVAAPVPPFEELLRPVGWGYHGALTATFWVCAAALVAAVADLVYRSVAAVAHHQGSRRRERGR